MAAAHSGSGSEASSPRCSPATSEASAMPADDDAPLYKTDEFRIYSMKVIHCSKRYVHDWTTCPFAHPGEKAKRRDPKKVAYTGIACPDMKKGGGCPRGDKCRYAHNVFEYWLHPTRYRTQLCNDGLNCKRRMCFFAHTLEQLRVPATKPFVPPDALAPTDTNAGLRPLPSTSINGLARFPRGAPSRGSLDLGDLTGRGQYQQRSASLPTESWASTQAAPLSGYPSHRARALEDAQAEAQALAHLASIQAGQSGGVAGPSLAPAASSSTSGLSDRLLSLLLALQSSDARPEEKQRALELALRLLQQQEGIVNDMHQHASPLEMGLPRSMSCHVGDRRSPFEKTQAFSLSFTTASQMEHPQQLVQPIPYPSNAFSAGSPALTPRENSYYETATGGMDASLNQSTAPLASGSAQPRDVSELLAAVPPSSAAQANWRNQSLPAYLQANNPSALHSYELRNLSAPPSLRGDSTDRRPSLDGITWPPPYPMAPMQEAGGLQGQDPGYSCFLQQQYDMQEQMQRGLQGRRRGASFDQRTRQDSLPLMPSVNEESVEHGDRSDELIQQLQNWGWGGAALPDGAAQHNTSAMEGFLEQRVPESRHDGPACGDFGPT